MGNYIFMVDRNYLFMQYITPLITLAKKYGLEIHPDYVKHEESNFMKMSEEEIQEELRNLPKVLESQERDFQNKQRDKDRKNKRDLLRQKSPGGAYDLVEVSFGRIICSSTNPEFEKKGMPGYPMQEIDPQLKGYYGVHVGDWEWLGILKRDGYCDGDAYLYTIYADQMVEDGISVYEMDDPHVSYRDDATPDSQIIFFKLKIIPNKYIELNHVIKEDDIEEAPSAYGMGDDGYDDEDEESF